MAKTRLRRCAMNGWTFHLSSRAWPTQVSLATIISTRDLACLKGWMRTCRTDQSETALSWLQPNTSCWRVELWPRIFLTRTNGGAGQRNWKRCFRYGGSSQIYGFPASGNILAFWGLDIPVFCCHNQRLKTSKVMSILLSILHNQHLKTSKVISILLSILPQKIYFLCPPIKYFQ